LVPLEGEGKSDITVAHSLLVAGMACWSTHCKTNVLGSDWLFRLTPEPFLVTTGRFDVRLAVVDGDSLSPILTPEDQGMLQEILAS
jgi:hypothetical protein